MQQFNVLALQRSHAHCDLRCQMIETGRGVGYQDYYEAIVFLREKNSAVVWGGLRARGTGRGKL